MIDNPENPSHDANNNEEEDFAAMLEDHMSNVRDDLSVGEEIQGKVISIGDESIFIDTGTKVDGVVDKMELCDKEGQPGCQVGDIVKLYVISIGDGEIRLSKAVSGPGSENRLYDAQKHGIPVEGKVAETCKGGFRVHIMGKIAFCPVSQIDVAYVEEPETYIGKSFEFLITRIESRGKNIVVSRRDLLNRQIAEERQKFIEAAKPGDIFDARVTRIMSYGAFAEVAPGVEGMIHISELGWSRVENPGDVVSVNDVVKVSLLGIEEGKDKSRTQKISLSMKHAMGDPWNDIFDRHQEGDRVRGTVTRCADFGAFVEIEPGVEGLVHISELSYRRVMRADDVVKPGDVVGVTIKSIDPAARRISLSMKDAEGDPWLHIADNYAIGQPTAGRIEKKEKFGYFVELEPGITGLLPVSKIKGSAKANDIEKLKVGDTVTLTVDSIDVNSRKISLGLGDDAAAADDSSWKNYKKEQPGQKIESGFGALGEKIKAAMEKSGKQ